jgi:hypothetical protein
MRSSRFSIPSGSQKKCSASLMSSTGIATKGDERERVVGIH